MADTQVATGVFRLDERATNVGVDRLICVVGRTEGITYEQLVDLGKKSPVDVSSCDYCVLAKGSEICS